MRARSFSIVLALLIALVGLWLARDSLSAWMFELTGEDELAGQLRGFVELATQFTRPAPNLASDTPVAYSGVSPFGVNTFLHQEVEPAKRAQQVRLAAEAGFAWIRQPFP